MRDRGEGGRAGGREKRLRCGRVRGESASGPLLWQVGVTFLPHDWPFIDGQFDHVQAKHD